MIESIHFGQTKDTYTGSGAFQAGLLKNCDGGTVLFNDRDILSQKYQSRLLQFLDTSTFFRLGTLDVLLHAAEMTSKPSAYS